MNTAQIIGGIFFVAIVIIALLPGVLWGLGIVAIGLYILFNKKEDTIEEINDNHKNYGKNTSNDR
ncbi:MAG: hypothetical protein Q8P93_00080 [bacterium]|nr:hypothetical protein [bacterium]